MLYSQIQRNHNVSTAVLGAVAERHGPLLYRPQIHLDRDGFDEMIKEQGICLENWVQIKHVSYPRDYGMRLIPTDNSIAVHYETKTIYLALTSYTSERSEKDQINLICRAIESMAMNPLERLLKRRAMEKEERYRVTVQEYQSSIAGHYNSIITLEACLVESTILLNAYLEQDIDSRYDLQQEMNKIANLSQVREVSIQSDQWLNIRLKPIICDYRNLGSIRISIDLAADGLKLKMYNVTKPFRKKTNENCHPHVDTGGSPCWGNIAQIVIDLMMEWKLTDLVSVCIGFLEVWYPNGQPFIESMNPWGPELNHIPLSVYPQELRDRQQTYNDEWEDSRIEHEYDEDCTCDACTEE